MTSHSYFPSFNRSALLDAERFALSVRGHWSIENQLHWILDVGFQEDQARSIQGYSGENLAVIRHLAVNLLTQEKSAFRHSRQAPKGRLG